MIGNFIADAVKGSAHEKFPDEIRKGILLHRAIDFYSDNHPVFIQSVTRLRPAYKKYAGVIIDIYYDHFLAKNWSTYNTSTLSEYADYVHNLLLKNTLIIPEKSLLFLKYALRTNRLVSYATIQGMEEVFLGMSKRTTFKSNMENATTELKKYYSEFGNEFKLFFGDVQVFATEWIRNN